MSLVSYADSDDSGEEDIGESEVQTNVDKEEERAVENKKINLQIKEAKQTKSQQNNTDNTDANTKKPKSIGSLFSSLPAPWMSTITWANKSSDKKSEKEKQATIKITVPSLGYDVRFRMNQRAITSEYQLCLNLNIILSLIIQCLM
jgi:hypothetical protein